MKKLFLVLCVIMLYIGVLLYPIKAEAATATYYSTYTQGYQSYSGWAEAGYSANFTINSTWNIAHIANNFPLTLPIGVKLTSATLYSTFYINDANSESSGSISFLGNTWSGYAWCTEYPYNVLGDLSDYSGGAVTKTITNTANNITSSGSGTRLSSYGYLIPTVSQRPRLVLTYEYVPSTPTISSPTAGSYNNFSAVLSASSTVTGGATITYNWQYSLDGLAGWTNIANTTSSAYIWTIPGSIPLNSSIYIRVSGTANGVTSQYSGLIRINKAGDPVIAAKLAAESAEAKAEIARATTVAIDTKITTMDTKINNIDTKVNQIMAADTIVPTIVDFVYGIDKATVSRTSINTFSLIATDNKSSNLLYRYSINNGAYTAWGAVVGNTVSADLGASVGVKKVIIQVKDEAGNLSSAMTSLFKL